MGASAEPAGVGREVEAARRILAAVPGGTIHLVGIGGVGMAGLAVQLASRGFKVSGCDGTTSRVTDWLRAQGVLVEAGHAPAHLSGREACLIRSAAVPENEPEVATAIARGLPVFRRGAVLPVLLDDRTSIAVAGTHGKTTTSSMIVQALRAAGVDPGYAIGGEVDGPGVVAAPGDGRWLVVEADESDGTLAGYRPDVAVVTNIEFDHMEHFCDEAALVACFEQFVRQARQRVVYGADDSRAAELCASLPNAVSYGWSERADVHGELRNESEKGLRVRVATGGEFTLPVPGRHNGLNALAAWAVVQALVPTTPARLAGGLSRFRPVRRRFERVGEADGVRIVSDYAHHPTEIRAVLDMARHVSARKRWVVFQPHRYTRTRALGPDFPPAFAGTDEIVLTPVYAASEPPLDGGTTEDLLKHFEKWGKVPVRCAGSLEEARSVLRDRLQPGDLLLVLGAGDVERLGPWVLEDVRQRAAGAERM